MKITYYGHSCFGVETGGKHLLFDPFITGNALAANIHVNSIPADFILLSHAHGDHVGDVEVIAERTKATIICNAEMANYYGEKKFKCHPVNHGGAMKFDFGEATYVNAVHSSTFPDGTPGGNPGGFVVATKEGAFYFAGDTALTMDMKLIPLRHKLKFALLPIGSNYTMDYTDAITASDFIECNKVIGMHYDSFPVIKIDHEAAKNAFKASGKELLLLDVGGSINL